MANEQRHIRVEGRVQGVSYRAYAQKKATELGLIGFARNLPDGQVEIVAEGPADNLQLFVDWCREGSPASEVSAVQAHSYPATGQFPDFTVR